jgi:hypothetical protein
VIQRKSSGNPPVPRFPSGSSQFAELATARRALTRA